MSAPDTIGISQRQLAELQRTFETKATQVEQLGLDLALLVGAEPWHPITEPFRAAWEAVHHDALRAVVVALEDQAHAVGLLRRRPAAGPDR